MDPFPVVGGAQTGEFLEDLAEGAAVLVSHPEGDLFKSETFGFQQQLGRFHPGVLEVGQVGGHGF